MKKISKVLVALLLVCILFTFVGCNKYAEEAGVYECYELRLNGKSYMYAYDYYRIILNADGTCVVESKGVDQASKYRAEATFSIENDKIIIVTKTGSSSVTEVYDYVDGEIIMATTVSGVTMYAKFARETEEE